MRIVIVKNITYIVILPDVYLKEAARRHMKQIFLFICKFIISGICAMLVLSVFALIYHNPPIAEAQPDKYTNSKFTQNTFWSYMGEGFGYGKTNNLGYIDEDQFDPSVPLIAFLGSSHTEALEVPQKKNYVSQLQNKLFDDADTGNDLQCLNLGVSGHFFNICVSNFEYLPETIQNAKHIVIETGNIVFSETQLTKMLDGQYHVDMEQRGKLYDLAQKIPYLRLFYKQYQDTKQTKATTSKEIYTDYVAYELGLTKVLEKLSNIADKYNIQLTILYHNSIDVHNRVASRKDDPRLLDVFSKCCEKYDIGFIDVTNQFVDHFNSTYELPYGFSNTTLGFGHLNKVGHSIIATELYNYLTEYAEEKNGI